VDGTSSTVSLVAPVTALIMPPKLSHWQSGGVVGIQAPVDDVHPVEICQTTRIELGAGHKAEDEGDNSQIKCVLL